MLEKIFHSKVFRKILQIIERTFKCRIFRKSLPRGTDIFFDINNLYGIKNFQTVFDVGANVGQSAIEYSEKFPYANIYSFEPVSSSFQNLKKNTEHLDRVHVFHNGFGSKLEEPEININDDYSEVNSIRFNKGSKTEKIKVLTIDHFAEKESIDKIDFLKIDTEGYELEVLNGVKGMLENKKIGLIYIECELIETDKHFVTFDKLVENISQYGYELLGIYEQQPHWTGEKTILYCNPVFISPELVSKDVNSNNYPLK